MTRLRLAWFAAAPALCVVACGVIPTDDNNDDDADDGASALTCSETGATTSIEGAWRASKARFETTEFGTYAVEAESRKLPTLTTVDTIGAMREVVFEIEGTTRRTYVRAPNGTVTYRLTTELFDGGNGLYVDVTAGQTSGVTDTFEVRDGCLFATATLPYGYDATGGVVTVDTTFDRLDGPMPPADWPAQIVDLPQTFTSTGGQP